MILATNAFAAALLVSSAAATTSNTMVATIDGPEYIKPQTLVEVEPGRRLNLYCVGVGEPAVVFEAGLTDPINVWGLVQPKIGSATKACAYDRAGIGFSDEQTRPSSSANIVDDLHMLLAAAGIKLPVILVGASSGGMHIRLYAYTYPAEVAGLVLVDPSHEDQTESFRKVDPRGLSASEWDAQVLRPGLDVRKDCIKAAEAGIVDATVEYKKCSFPQYPQLSEAVKQATDSFQLTPKFQRAQLSEEEAIFHASVEELHLASRPLGNLPVIVLTKDRPPPPESPSTPEQDELREARYQVWKSLGSKSAAISTAGVQRVVPGAGHGIGLEKPDAVIEAVMEVLAEARANNEAAKQRQ